MHTHVDGNDSIERAQKMTEKRGKERNIFRKSRGYGSRAKEVKFSLYLSQVCKSIFDCPNAGIETLKSFLMLPLSLTAKSFLI